MCGIFGYFCTDQYDPRIAAAVPILALHMRDRGKHSWGITDGTDVQKFKGDIQDTFENQFLGSKQLLGHTRFGTVGALTAENSHPFKIGSLLGVHNGQVYNHKTVADKYGITYNVDSEVLLDRIANRGDMAEIEAYGAVVFFEEGIIHLGKFNGGVLELARTEWGWMWASTRAAVEGALQMAGLKSTGKWWVKMKEGKLYKLIGNEIVKDDRRLNVGKQATHTASVSSSTYGGWHGHHGWQEDLDYEDRRSAGHYSSTGAYAHAAGRYYSAKEMCYLDPKDGKRYRFFADKDPIPDKVLPLPTAETTTFTAEPSSDQDEVVDTKEREGDEDVVAEYEQANGCSFCHDSLYNKEYVVVRGDHICNKCYKAFMGNTDEPEQEYNFVKMTADEIYETYRSTDLMQCEDCGELPMDDEPMYVDESKSMSVCEQCYNAQYFDIDTGVEDEADEATETASTDKCGTSVTSYQGETKTHRFCAQDKGHEGDCIDEHGEVVFSMPSAKESTPISA